jgi:hypothetical protein
MPRKIETLYHARCKTPIDDERGICYECREFVPDPIPESELETEQEIEYLS